MVSFRQRIFLSNLRYPDFFQTQKKRGHLKLSASFCYRIWLDLALNHYCGNSLSQSMFLTYFLVLKDEVQSSDPGHNLRYTSSYQCFGVYRSCRPEIAASPRSWSHLLRINTVKFSVSQ